MSQADLHSEENAPPRPKRPALGQIILLATGLVVLTAISITSVYFVNRAREDARWALHSMEVENEISLAQLQMRRAESAQRGFLLTQQPAFRTAFEEAADQIAPSFDRLRNLTLDNPYQQERLKQMVPLTEERMKRLRDSIQLAGANHTDEAANIVQEDAGRDAMGQIRDLAGEMRGEEDRLFAARTTSVVTTGPTVRRVSVRVDGSGRRDRASTSARRAHVPRTPSAC